MKKYIIVLLALPLFVFADIEPKVSLPPDTRGIIFLAPNSVDKLPRPDDPVPPEQPSVPMESSSSGPSGGGFMLPSREELRWLASGRDLSGVKFTLEGLVMVEKNYSVNPLYLSYGGYLKAVEMGK